MILPGETEAGTAGAQTCRGIWGVLEPWEKVFMMGGWSMAAP